jgi:hypothetical protein
LVEVKGAMLNLITWHEDGPVVRYPFGTSGPEDEVWEHTAVIAPLASCYEEALLPLAGEQGERLTADAVLRAAVGWAAGAQTPAAGIDWLGLALYAVQRHRQALGQLLVRPPAECQAACDATAILAEVLEQLYERLARALRTELGSAA